MEFCHRFSPTVKLIRHALFPEKRGGASRPLHDNSRGLIAPVAFASVLADLNSLVLPDGRLELHFSRVLPLAAPFLLYRCKADGFSACRATIIPDGILLTALR